MRQEALHVILKLSGHLFSRLEVHPALSLVFNTIFDSTIDGYTEFFCHS